MVKVKILDPKNKTNAYLLPVMKKYKDNYIKVMNAEIFKKYLIQYSCVGIGDNSFLRREGNLYDRHLFFLVKVHEDSTNFNTFLEIVRKQPYYEDDYEYGDYEDNYHMLVFKIPESHHKALDEFLESKYSKMYSESDIKELIRSNNKKVIAVLKRDLKSEYALELAASLGVSPSILPELDTKIKLHEEIFNFTEEQDDSPEE